MHRWGTRINVTFDAFLSRTYRRSVDLPHLLFRLALDVIDLVLAQTTDKINLSPNVIFSSTVRGSLELLYHFSVISNVTDLAYDTITAFVVIEIRTKF